MECDGLEGRHGGCGYENLDLSRFAVTILKFCDGEWMVNRVVRGQRVDLNISPE